MSGPLRHRDEGDRLGGFRDRIEVRCPRCGHAGSVLAGVQDHGGWDARFVCGHCQLQACDERGDWLGRVRLRGHRPCGYCGHQWLRVNELRAAAPAYPIASLPVQCPVCARSSEVQIETVAHVVHDGHDPHFGLPLRLIEPTRSGLLWVYNAEHLSELRRYITATQRERCKSAGNASMISRLPAWMKLARHRPMMLKALDRLQARLLGTAGIGNNTTPQMRSGAGRRRGHELRRR